MITSQVAHQAEALYLSLCRMKRLGVFLLPPGWDFINSRATTHLSFCVEKGTIRVKCLSREHNAVLQPGLEPGPLDPESSELTFRSPNLPLCSVETQRNYFTFGLMSVMMVQAQCNYNQSDQRNWKQKVLLRNRRT